MTNRPTIDDLEAEAAGDRQRFASGMTAAQRDLFDTPVKGPVMGELRTYPVKGEHRPHQERALREADLRPGHAYFVDPGGGKTRISIAEAGLLYQMNKIDSVLILAPNGVHEQWIDQQLEAWCDVDYWGLHNRRTPKTIRDTLKRRREGQLAFLAMNYEAIITPKGRALMEQFLTFYPRFMLIVDESHKVKSNTAKTTHEAMRWALRARYRRILSGTPLLRGVEDLWSQYEIVQPGLGWPMEPIKFKTSERINTFGYLGFRQHYCVIKEHPDNPRQKMIVGYRNEDELVRRVAPFVTRIKSEEFATMAEADIIPISCPMTVDQASAYRSMKEHLLAEIDSGTITAQNALVQMGKLMQIAAGFLYEEDGRYQVLSRNKLETTLDLLAQLDEPVIVWTPFKAQQQQLLIELGDLLERQRPGARPYFAYDGTASVTAWKCTRNGVLFGNQSSGMGVGLNLQHAAANIYMSNSFAAEARWQSIKRTDRIGQTRQVRVWDLIAPRTVDEKVMAALRRKEDLSIRTIDALREVIV